MKLTFDTYEEFGKFITNSACPSDLGFEDVDECDGGTQLDKCAKCWEKCGMNILIKENPTKKITLEFELPMCPYWDPITKTARYTCGGCRCDYEGNTVGNAQYGVMVNGDRYCCLDDSIDICAGIVEAVKED